MSRNAKDWFTFIDLLQRRQIDFVSVTQPFLDTTTPYGRAMVGSMMIFAQLEVEIDSQRIAEDIEYRQSEGQMWGPVPMATVWLRRWMAAPTGYASPTGTRRSWRACSRRMRPAASP